MNGPRKLLLAAAALLALSAAGALDLRNGRMLLALDERTARFSVHFLADAARNRYVSLLSEQDARTSYPTLSWDGKIYRLGEAADFKFSVLKEGTGAVVEYRSSFAVVRQAFSFLRSRGSPETDGISVEFTLENISGKSASAGLRFLLDTYQGERSKRHFEIEGRGFVSAELSLNGASVPGRISTPGDSGASLQIQLSGEGITRPNRLVMANWKRINDAEWSFETSPGRSFTLLPFSIDDSAVVLYFEPSELRSGGKLVLRTILGNTSESGFSAPPLSGALAGSQATESLSPMTVAPDPFVGARTDIAALREILSRIDALLSVGGNPDPVQLAELRRLLDNIRTRTKDY